MTIPKRGKRRPAYSDSYLNQLWTKAVRVQKGEMCCNPECRNPATGTHHLIKRRYKVLKYDVKNGLPLCSVCHPIADRNSAWALSLVSEEDREYLGELGKFTLDDYLAYMGKTRDEFLAGEAAELKRIIEEGR
jgi:hypothetical protein